MRYWLVGFILVALGVGFFSVSVPGGENVPDKAVAKRECQTTSIEIDFGPEYEGTLIDTHIHIPHPPENDLDSFTRAKALGSKISLGDYECLFKNENTAKAFAFFPVFPGMEEEHLAVVKKAMETYSDIFVPFIMSPDDDGSPDGFPTVTAAHLKEVLAVYPGLFRGYGEIGLYARGDHGGPRGAPALPPDSKRLQEIYPVVRENDLLVYFHLGEGQQKSFEQALAANRDINFIFHGDQLIKYDDSGQNLGALDEILSRHRNAYYGIDELYGDVWLLKPGNKKEDFLKHFENYGELLDKDVETWKKFIERHPRQVLWGTDRGVSADWDLDLDVGLYLTHYARAFIARLDPAVQENFAYKNAMQLIEGVE